MTAKKSTFLSNPWIVGIGTTVLATGVLKLVDIIADTQILSEIGKFFVVVGGLFASLGGWFAETHSLPMWLIIFLPISIPLLIVFLIWLPDILPKSKEKEVSPEKHPYIIYKSDVFKGILFRWHWTNSYLFSGDAIPEPEYISPYCPLDECPLVSKKCPICGTDYSAIEYTNKEIEVAIQYYVSKNQWKDRYDNSPITIKRNNELKARYQKLKAEGNIKHKKTDL